MWVRIRSRERQSSITHAKIELRKESKRGLSVREHVQLMQSCYRVRFNICFVCERDADKLQVMFNVKWPENHKYQPPQSVRADRSCGALVAAAGKTTFSSCPQPFTAVVVPIQIAIEWWPFNSSK